MHDSVYGFSRRPLLGSRGIEVIYLKRPRRLRQMNRAGATKIDPKSLRIPPKSPRIATKSPTTNLKSHRIKDTKHPTHAASRAEDTEQLIVQSAHYDPILPILLHGDRPPQFPRTPLIGSPVAENSIHRKVVLGRAPQGTKLGGMYSTCPA
jgi:hypothetical protein